MQRRRLSAPSILSRGLSTHKAGHRLVNIKRPHSPRKADARCPHALEPLDVLGAEASPLRALDEDVEVGLARRHVARRSQRASARAQRDRAQSLARVSLACHLAHVVGGTHSFGSGEACPLGAADGVDYAMELVVVRRGLGGGERGFYAWKPAEIEGEAVSGAAATGTRATGPQSFPLAISAKRASPRPISKVLSESKERRPALFLTRILPLRSSCRR